MYIYANICIYIYTHIYIYIYIARRRMNHSRTQPHDRTRMSPDSIFCRGRACRRQNTTMPVVL